MLFENISFNKAVDIAPVDQTGYVDLSKSHAMGSVPAMLDTDTLEYNGIEDPNSIAARVSDVFDGMATGHALVARAKSVKAAEKAAAAANAAEQ